MPLTLGSLFAGIGGFDLGFERAGFKTVWQCEIDKAAQGVLRRHFPEAKRFSDVREVGAYNLGPVDVITYGSPCQDLSVAGKRAGLAGNRSGLFHEAARIIQELREQHGKPDFAIWENVPGAFSSNEGRDFAAVVQTMVDLGARDVAWRVLDSRYFGVAQRRRRVFLVADFGGERAEQILFEPESLRGDTAPRRKARKEATRGAGAGATSGSYWDGGQLADTLDSSMTAKRQTMPERRRFAAVLEPIPCDGSTDGVVPPLMARSSRGGAQTLSPGHQPVVAPTSQDVSHLPQTVGALCSRDFKGVSTQYVDECKVMAVPMINMQGSKGGTATVAVAFDLLGTPASEIAKSVDIHTPLRARMPGQMENSTTTVAVCATGEVTHTLTCTALKGATEDGTGRGVPRAAHLAYSTKLHNTASNNAGKIFIERTTALDASSPPPALLTAMQVRRLMPTECESLQGFPRNWTAEIIAPNGTLKQQADGPRYKQLGNAVTVNVAEWLAKRVSAAIKG